MDFKNNKSNDEHHVVQMILISLDLIKERGKYYFFQAVQLTFAPTLITCKHISFKWWKYISLCDLVTDLNTT